MKNENQKYLDGLRAGDESVIRILYSRNLPKVINWIRNKGGTEADAQDVFQDSMEAVLALAFKEDFTVKSSLDSLIVKICKNKWIDTIRKNVKQEKVRNDLHQRLEYNDQSHLVDETMQNEYDLRGMLNETLVMISPLCQQLLKLSESGASPKEIAQLLNMSGANSVYRRKFACLEAWRKQIEQHPYYTQWKNNQT